jgi:hypothetical protein
MALVKLVQEEKDLSRVFFIVANSPIQSQYSAFAFWCAVEDNEGMILLGEKEMWEHFCYIIASQR